MIVASQVSHVTGTAPEFSPVTADLWKIHYDFSMNAITITKGAVQWTSTDISTACFFKFLQILSQLYYAWQFGSRFYAINFCKKYKNNNSKFSEMNLFGVVKTLVALCTMRLKTYCFLSGEPAFVLKRTSLFFSPKAPCKILCPCT